MSMSVMVVLSGLLLLLAASNAAGGAEERRLSYSRDDFPEGFVFGSGTSAYQVSFLGYRPAGRSSKELRIGSINKLAYYAGKYVEQSYLAESWQVEGAAAEDGRTPSIWDTFTHAGYTNGTGDITADGYHKFKEDVNLMAETGLEGYRFSISWSRLIPGGRGKINPKGLEYYNNLINELLRYGIQPHATLFHFDLPQVLEDEYEGWLSPKVIDDFTAYADVCFREFGDRVFHWTTLNEANVFPLGGYDIGITPPRRCSYPFGNCTHGDSTTEPYTVAHHILLAHSSVALLYREKYQAQQKGFVGLNILGFCFQSATNSTRDIDAAKRIKDFYTGWLIEPLVRGNYPETMRELAGKKMPEFSTNQSKQLKGSADFIGLNYYLTIQVADDPNTLPSDQRDFTADMSTQLVGNVFAQVENYAMMNPYGLQELLELFKEAYGNPPIYIHENGVPTRDGTLNDTARVEKMSAHLICLLDSIRNGSDTRGYFNWSFMDVFELFTGYDTSFGLYYVDFESNERTRTAKFSARWYSDFLKRKAALISIGKDSSHTSPHSISMI